VTKTYRGANDKQTNTTELQREHKKAVVKSCLEPSWDNRGFHVSFMTQSRDCVFVSCNWVE